MRTPQRLLLNIFELRFRHFRRGILILGYLYSLEGGADGVFHFLTHFGMILQVLAGILAALGNALVLIAEPRAALMDDIALHGHIQDGALAADALAIEQIEFRRAEGRGHLDRKSVV